jgi:hypothetical protein
VIAGPGEPIAAVGLHERVDPLHAPQPFNESERLLFRQLYETLVRADCAGSVAPGLAASWRLDGDGRTWIVTLRDDARFSDGTPVLAADVRASWTRDGVQGDLLPSVARLIQSVSADADRALAITLRSDRVDVPLVLAHADLAVAKRVAGAAWPLGTRSARIASDSPVSRASGRSAFTLIRDGLPPVRFVVAPGDPRDLLDEGVDLLLTRDPAALGYAATLPQFQSVPLAWRQVHVLLIPGRLRALPPIAEDARDRLAADAIRGEARGARGPFWWESAETHCGVAPTPPRHHSSPSPARRIVYDAGDGAARDLAERFVGLASAAGQTPDPIVDAIFPNRAQRTGQRAAGLAGEALATARRLGGDAGYIVSLDSRPVDPCRDLQVLMDTARWVDPATIVPLVETRVQAIVRRGRTGVMVEWDGGLSIAAANDLSKR